MTGPEKPRIEVPVIVTLPDAPRGRVIILGDVLRLKSPSIRDFEMVEIGTDEIVETVKEPIVSLAILFAPDSSIQTLPALSTTTLCGVLLANAHSVNWVVVVPVLVEVDDATTVVETDAVLDEDVISFPGGFVGEVIVGWTGPVTRPPPEGSRRATLPAPSSAIHGF